MELQFQKRVCACLNTVLREVRNQEQTLEIKLPDSMPDIGRILCAWGQSLLRSKEWRDGEISLSGGMLVWVLYAPEDGTQPRCIDSWIPFQMRWDLPPQTKEGDIRFSLLTRFVDARSVSARKMMVRAGIAAMAQALCPMEAEVYSPENVPEGVQLLRRTYPLRLPREAGEKSFRLDEDLSLPASAPEPEKLMYYTVNPRINDQKVLGNKLVFRGNARVHMLYVSEEGQLFSWDFDVPFSQFAELREAYSADAQADVLLCPTNLELEADEEGTLHLKCGFAAQYLIDDVELLELTEDAYSPGRETELHSQQLVLPAILETRRENIYGEQSIPGEAGIVTDVQFLPDFPRQRRTGNGIELEVPGSIQMLYYAEDGSLQSAGARWEGKQTLRADEDSLISAIPQAGAAEILPGSMTVKAEVPLVLTTTGSRGMPMVTGLELGQQQQPDPQRPSLILRRAGEMGLWDMAKVSGSTMDAIRKANGLEADPAPGQMLLIPVT